MRRGARRLALEERPRERWPPFPANSEDSPFGRARREEPEEEEESPARSSRNKGSRRTLILINCLIFSREVRAHYAAGLFRLLFARCGVFALPGRRYGSYGGSGCLCGCSLEGRDVWGTMGKFCMTSVGFVSGIGGGCGF